MSHTAPLDRFEEILDHSYDSDYREELEERFYRLFQREIEPQLEEKEEVDMEEIEVNPLYSQEEIEAMLYAAQLKGDIVYEKQEES